MNGSVERSKANKKRTVEIRKKHWSQLFVLMFSVFWIELVPLASIGSAVAYSLGELRLLPLFCFCGYALFVKCGITLSLHLGRQGVIECERGDHSRVARVCGQLFHVLVARFGIIISVIFASLFLFGLDASSGDSGILVLFSAFLLPLCFFGKLIVQSRFFYGWSSPIIHLGWMLFVMVGACSAQTGQFDKLSLVASFPVGSVGIATVLLKFLSDFDVDRDLGLRTVAILFGRYYTLTGYKISLFSAYLGPIFLALTGLAGAFILLPLCTLPLARVLAIKIDCDLDVNLESLRQSTSRFVVVFCLMFAFGFIYRF